MVTIVVAAGVPLLGKPLDWQNSVSYSWSGSRRQWLVTAIVMTLAVTGTCTSLVWWLIPHYHLPAVMYGFVVMGYVAAMGVAWAPMTDRPGEHSYLHAHFLGGAAVATLAFVILAIVLWFGVSVPTTARTVCIAAMILALCWPLLFFTPARRVFLALESVLALTISAAVILLLVG